MSPKDKVREIDAILLSKFDTVDDKGIINAYMQICRKKKERIKIEKYKRINTKFFFHKKKKIIILKTN